MRGGNLPGEAELLLWSSRANSYLRTPDYHPRVHQLLPSSTLLACFRFFKIYTCNQSKMRSRKQRQESVDSSQTQSEKAKKKKKHAKFSVSRKHKATDSLSSRQTHALHGSEGKTRETTTGHRRSNFRKDLLPPFIAGQISGRTSDHRSPDGILKGNH